MGGFFFTSGQIRKIKRAVGRPAPQRSLPRSAGCGIKARILNEAACWAGKIPLGRGAPNSALNLPDLARDKKKSTHFDTLCFGQSKL